MADKDDPLGLVGTTIADKYAVESVVGHGGFAVVYRAMHNVWKRPVAVKVFKSLSEVPHDQREKLLADFVQEGALLADLSERSAAICQARDIGTFESKKGEKVPYLVLEWLDGKPLESVLEDERARGVPLRTLPEVLRLLEPVAEALSLAHKKGIAHRDVKPANVFVLGDPRAEHPSVKLLDFGIAKVVQDAQKAGFGKTAGHITSFTPLYGAPEQFNRAYGATGPWTDVFALALVFAEVASGKEPMSGDNLVQLAYASADPQKRPTPRALGVATSDEVEAAFQKAVAVTVADRFQTVGDMWSAIRAAILGTSAHMAATAPTVDPNAATLMPGSFGPGSRSSGTVRVAPPPSGAITGPHPHAATGPAPPSFRQGPASAPAPAPASKSPSGLVVAGIGVLALLVVGGGVAVFRAKTGGKHGRRASPPPSASAVTSVAAGAASACPAGMVYVPGGAYFMGSDTGEGEDNERPKHKVTLAPYCLDAYEVTVAKYKQCSDNGGCLRAGFKNVWPNITPQEQKVYDPLCNLADAATKADHPINCVDWQQAKEFCATRGARLPTEAEWEFAALGPDGRTYPWGDEAPSAGHLNACGRECVAWMSKHPDGTGFTPEKMYDGDDGYANTAPVGKFPQGKSRYGAYDLVGNVWEWVADWYGPYGAESRDKTMPNPVGPPSGKERVIRGGAWNGSKTSWVRPAFRFSATPDWRTYAIGFRCASSAGAP